ncbi:tRNA (guanosine(46)-N7)-methyltransferase TrmB [Anditalea andensis]|uniref:tRNA (guanine-N(7)-)-methyltransferase n=1 Tax=Anditalea andensis TaxID=1048983 RepID=A0A074KYG7_9BACT|nr:tRNA (guanosine(46)-N7)-methyltransferase TrmB [Anditalea andensis]KEO74004.1 tRNA (guanine-N7)-methyltransferase [Anditalea andensis]
MGRNKLVRFKQNEESKNVIQEGKPLFEKIKGNWNALQFENDHPIVVELACGRGEFTVGLARENAAHNFIGIDIKGSRIWKGSTIAATEKLENVAFLRTQIEQLEKYFGESEIHELWITFPDPRPRDGDEKKRLTSPRFLEMYKPLLDKGGIIHLKTDNTGLFEYTLEVLNLRKDLEGLEWTFDFYASEYQREHLGIKTRYEKIFSDKGEKIKYLRFRFKKD